MNDLMQGDDFVDATMANLKIISMLQKNDKIRVHKGNISIDRGDGAVQAVRRWLNRDSRDVTLIHVRNTISNAIRIACTLSSSIITTTRGSGLKDWTLQRFVGEMAAAELGLQNLRATYMMDSGVVASIDVMTERLRANCDELIRIHGIHASAKWKLNYVADLRDVDVQCHVNDDDIQAPANFSCNDNIVDANVVVSASSKHQQRLTSAASSSSGQHQHQHPKATSAKLNN